MFVKITTPTKLMRRSYESPIGTIVECTDWKGKEYLETGNFVECDKNGNELGTTKAKKSKKVENLESPTQE